MDGSFFMTESFDEEENEFNDDFEKHKVRNRKLENGHRKHLKKPRNSLHDFEQMENLCNLQNGHAQNPDDEGMFNGFGRHAENDRSISLDSQDQSESSFGGSTFDKEELRRIEKAADMSFNNTREDGRKVGNGYWNNGYGFSENGVGDGSDVQTLSDGAPPDEDQDPSSEIIMQKYMEETPRTRRVSSGVPSSPHFSDVFRDSPGGSPSHGQAFEVESNTNFNNNKGVPLDERLEEVTNSSRKSDGLFSLSQEQPPSHLEEFDDDEDGTDEQSELGETAIPAGLEEAIQRAAQNVQEFGSETEERQSERHSESSVSIQKHKPVAVSGHKRKKSKGSSSRSSQEGSSRSRLRHSPEASVNDSEASVIAEDKCHVGRKDLGAPGLHTKEESSLKQRLSSRIPALNLQDMTDTESDPDNPTPRSKEELSSRLSEERKTRRQTTQVVEQLQLDYDELLAKYAQAENTIDQLRLGAKVNLYSDMPPRGQSSVGTLTPAKQPQKFDLTTPQRANLSRTSRDIAASSGMMSSTGGGGGAPHEDTLTSQRVSHDMRLTVANLTQQIPLLKRAIDTNQVPVAEQQELFNQLKETHGQLEEEYLQRMEEVKEQQRWSSVLPDSSVEQFDPEKSLEGKIFQVGMKLEDLQEKVEENVRKNPPEISTPSRHSGSRRQSFHQDIPKEEVAKPQLPPEYIQLLQKYETLKQLPANPKRDQEIQKLVKEIDNLQVSPKDEENYMSERSEVSSSSRRRSNRMKERAASSGRGTPSSARSLERQKSDSDEEILSRNSKKTVRPISIPAKIAGVPGGDSGSSHPRSPEHEIDSGFVGSEGSRQSQQSKQNYIPSSRTTSGSHRTRSEPGTHKSRARLRKSPHHTPIQELSERGQQSSSQSESRRRSGHSQKPKPVSTTSEEEEEIYKKGSLDRQSRTHRRSATPSSNHSSHQQQIHSPLPSKPKVEDFPRRSLFSPPKRSVPSQRNVSSSSKVSPQSIEPVRLEDQGSKKRNTGLKSSSSGKTKVDPSIERLRRRRDSDIGSSGSKSVRSEEVLALQREVAALKQQLHPSVGRGSLQSRSVISEDDEDNETEGEDDVYMVGRSHDGYEMNSVKSSRSSKSERLAELRAEMDQLKEDLLHSRETGGRSQRKLTPSTTSTPAFENGRSHHKLPDWEEEYKGYPSPIRERKQPVKERDVLRETLRKKYIPTSKSPRPVKSSQEYRKDGLSFTDQDVLGHHQRQRQKDLIRPSELSHNGNNTYGYSRTGHDHLKADPVFNPLSSLGNSPYVAHQNSSSQQTTTNLPCQHCNGSGIHHSHPEIGQRFTHQSPAMQQAPTTFVQPPPNTTIFVPNANPLYHSTPAAVHTPGTANVLQGPFVSQVPLSTSTQQTTPGSVIGGTTMASPQGNLMYATIPSNVPMTVLSSSPQVKVPQQVISVSPQEQSNAHGAAANGARPVYLVPSSKGRYYINDSPAIEDSDVEEIIYRRTPVKRTPSRKSKQVEFHTQVHLEESDLDETLYAAYHMAQRLKRSSEKVLESAQSSLQKAGLRKQLDFY